MLRELGGFDEDFFCIYEDADLSLRAQLQGYCCLYVPDAVVYHKVNSTLRRDLRQAVFYSQRNAEWLVWKNLPSPLLWKYLPQRLAYWTVSLLYFACRGRLLVFLHAKRAAWTARGKVRAKRAAVQQRRKMSHQYINSLLEPKWLRTRLAGKI